MKIIRTAMLSAILVVGASVASAATFTSDGTCGTAITTPSYDDCWGMANENANAQQIDVNGGDTFDGDYLFGQTDWEEIQSDGSFNGGPSGSFDIIANTFAEVVVLLKSSNTFGAYLFSDGLSDVELFFTTAGTSPQGASQGLSNYRVVGRGVSEVPLPASALLLLGGLGGLLVLRRRKA